jgi:hypothetical protein
LIELRRPGERVSVTHRTAPVKPPADDDGAIQFDLPEASETLPEALEDDEPQGPGAVIRFGGPDRASVETPSDIPLPRLETTPPAKAVKDPARDPRLTAPTPVQWHPAERGPAAAPESCAATPGAAAKSSPLWKKMKRKVLFWQHSTDVVQVSVFGPVAATPGQAVKLAVFLHTPDALSCVQTLSRAFDHDAELIGTGLVSREVPRAAELAVHVSVANAGVAKALLKFHWRGQPQRLNFDLHVPWESPEGPSPGLVSVGLDNVRVGKVEFRLHVLPRKAY